MHARKQEFIYKIKVRKLQINTEWAIQIVLKIFRKIIKGEKYYNTVINYKNSYKNVGFQYLWLALVFPNNKYMPIHT